MSPEIEAAFIAAGVSLIGVISTAAVAIFGLRATKDVTKTTVDAAYDTNKRTLEAQQRQQDQTIREQRFQTLNARFATAAEELGNDKPANVQLAGVHAMAGLADDWKENRQTCIDVLCAYLRMPYEPDPGEE